MKIRKNIFTNDYNNMNFVCFFPLYLKIFEKSPFLMKTPSQNFAHHTEVEKHPFVVKTPNLATLSERTRGQIALTSC